MSLVLQGVGININGEAMVQPFDLAIAAGEIVTLMGSSGSGKSSLLGYIAGDLAPPLQGHGTILLNNTEMNDVAPERRGIGRLFQDDLLFPHLTVGENLLFGIAKGDRSTRVALMQEALQQAGLPGFDNRPPHSLSGGQRARVALMRALLARPQAMLLDEPFNKLDQTLRETFRQFVFAHLRARNIPCLLVSHDRADAPDNGRVLAISEDGKLRHV